MGELKMEKKKKHDLDQEFSVTVQLLASTGPRPRMLPKIIQHRDRAQQTTLWSSR